VLYKSIPKNRNFKIDIESDSRIPATFVHLYRTISCTVHQTIANLMVTVIIPSDLTKVICYSVGPICCTGKLQVLINWAPLITD